MSIKYSLRPRRSASTCVAAQAIPLESSESSPSCASPKRSPVTSDSDFVASQSSDESHLDAQESGFQESLSPSWSPVKRSGNHKKPKTVAHATHREISETLLPDGNAVSSFAPADRPVIHRMLLDWYVVNYREFPWRPAPRHRLEGKPLAPRPEPALPSSPGAPYGVWISEIMSQQTRISVVCEYWVRWITVFPTLQALASAPLERVNEMWSGLGYYRRAKFLHEAANQVVNEYGGELPRTVAELKKIKGIGNYTAGAIASIAFDVPAPAVDGNVERVVARLLPGILPNREPTSSPGLKARAYDHVVRELISDIECAGDFNQAIMELGATVCTPKRPQCSMCPLKEKCGTYANAQAVNAEPAQYAERYPMKDHSRKTKVREERVFVSVVVRMSALGNNKLEYLLVQRPLEGLLAGLWECPNVALSAENAVKHNTTKGRRKLLDGVLGEILPEIQCEGEISLRHDLGETSHIFSHIRQTLHAEFVLVKSKGSRVPKGDGDSRPLRWLSEEALADSAVATQMRKVLKLASPYTASPQNKIFGPKLERDENGTAAGRSTAKRSRTR
jgi:A/G-specific adenine glycosylase